MSAERRGGPPAYWYDDRSVPAHARLLAALYGAVTGLRRSLYRKGLKRRRHPGVPVIVVGNITAGGAGKTPLTIALVQRLKQEGWNPGVATRGYGRDDAAAALWVERNTDARLGGDEPVLIEIHPGNMKHSLTSRMSRVFQLT